MSGHVEKRALLALYRNHPATAPGDRYKWKALSEATILRDMLLGWAATQSDETLLDCRNLGPTTLRWIRDQTGDPPSPFADLEAENRDLRARLRRIEEAARTWAAARDAYSMAPWRKNDQIALADAEIALRAALEAKP